MHHIDITLEDHRLVVTLQHDQASTSGNPEGESIYVGFILDHFTGEKQPVELFTIELQAILQLALSYDRDVDNAQTFAAYDILQNLIIRNKWDLEEGRHFRMIP